MFNPRNITTENPTRNIARANKATTIAPAGEESIQAPVKARLLTRRAKRWERRSIR